MTFRRITLARLGLGTALLCAICLAVPSGAANDRPAYWLPADAAIENVVDRLDLYYDGLSGRLVRADAGAAIDLEALGSTRVEHGVNESLYVYLLADADLAEFEPPARILVRSEREVLVATAGEAPELTAAAEAMLPGLRQPVRVSQTALVWPSLESAPPAPVRDYDPFIQQLADALTTQNYMVTWQALEDFVTRHYATPQNEAATQWILDQFLSFGLDAEFHYYEQNGPRRNVIATLPGTVNPSQVVYICGHLDSTSPSSSTCAPGADDNGSGTAGVIEAARVLSQHLFEYTIKFACWNGEEQGLVGSGAYCYDIAQAGENVIGAYNMDMIAYRGTDPAPPDLIIYTNSASQTLATTLSDACLDYTPGLLEPIVLVENMTASDHGSFWNNGYNAICAIEEEAWGPDFCPWYHTCDDLIFRYPQDYVVNCAKANLAALATTAVPVNPDGPYLVNAGTLLDDDANPPSSGDGDGLPNPGETIELWVTARNIGTATAQNVTGLLASSSATVNVMTAAAAWNDIPVGGEETNLTSFLFEISGTATDGETLPFTLTMTNDLGFQELSIQFTVVAPDLAYYVHGLDDSATGNGNGVIEAGEIILLPVSLANVGSKDAANVDAELVSASPYVTVLDGQASVTSIPTGGVAELAPAYRVQVAGNAPADEVMQLELAITAGAGYVASSGFKVKVGTHFYDDAEADGAWSLAVPDDDATTGRWVRVDPIGTSYNGQPCQTEDDHTATPWTDCYVTGQGVVGGSAGAADVDGGKTTLTSPTFDLTDLTEARLTYWRWYTNDLGSSGSEDYWVVQISPDGGTSWVDLERTMQSQNSWQEMSFLVQDYITPTDLVVVQFIASDENNGSLVEAAVDDFEITGEAGTVALVGGAPVLALRLAQAKPSPFRTGTMIPFSLPNNDQVSLKLYGVDGRLVRTLASGLVEAGVHEVAWDGANEAGQKVAPGVYFYSLKVGDRELTRKLVRVR